MQLFSHTAIIISLVALILIHVCTLFIKNAKLCTAISFVGIGLHVAVLPLLLYYKLSIEDSVLFYMISVFCYTLIHTLGFAYDKKRCVAKSLNAEENTNESEVSV